ncbi:protein IDA-LIKE 2-like [Cornus florida]|uniref:protein IDA-LIKE 2-like n=1 Tax=Cornus florida TaxID=4283 RepID=UPI00289BBD8C|nr:protein IDA-LIKE 2-like [Cornus florida]
MVRCKRPLIQLLWLVLLFIFIVGQCHGSRTIHVFKINPKPQNLGHFMGFLPRRIPIPSSGPSRKHNVIGLESWRSP